MGGDEVSSFEKEEREGDDSKSRDLSNDKEMRLSKKERKKRAKKRKEKDKDHSSDSEGGSKKCRVSQYLEEDDQITHKKKKKKRKEHLSEVITEEQQGTERDLQCESKGIESIESKGKREKAKGLSPINSKHEVGINQEGKSHHCVKHNDSNQTSSSKEKSVREPTNTGQWGSATFDDSERQEKFFRLLGGYKKKEDSHNLFKAKFANNAMNQVQEKTVEDKLESQYSQAMEKRRSGRGMGLGYSEAVDPGVKSVYIDKDKVRSIKFEAASD